MFFNPVWDPKFKTALLPPGQAVRAEGKACTDWFRLLETQTVLSYRLFSTMLTAAAPRPDALGWLLLALGS